MPTHWQRGMYTALRVCNTCSRACSAEVSTDTIEVNTAAMVAHRTDDVLLHMWNTSWQAEARRTTSPACAAYRIRDGADKERRRNLMGDSSLDDLPVKPALMIVRPRPHPQPQPYQACHQCCPAIAEASDDTQNGEEGHWSWAQQRHQERLREQQRQQQQRPLLQQDPRQEEREAALELFRPPAGCCSHEAGADAEGAGADAEAEHVVDPLDWGARFLTPVAEASSETEAAAEAENALTSTGFSSPSDTADSGTPEPNMLTVEELACQGRDCGGGGSGAGGSDLCGGDGSSQRSDHMGAPSAWKRVRIALRTLRSWRRARWHPGTSVPTRKLPDTVKQTHRTPELDACTVESTSSFRQSLGGA